MSMILNELLELLTLEEIDAGLYRGRSQDLGFRALFGGQVLGQALYAAKESVDPQRRCHSLHAYFLRPGDPHRCTVYEVEIIRDGGTMSTRRVSAVQKGQPIFYMTVSFQEQIGGFEHQFPVMPKVKAPEELLSEYELMQAVQGKLSPTIKAKYLTERPIIIKPLEVGDVFNPKPCDPVRMVWLKANGTMPADERLHKCMLAYASDFHFLFTALQPHALSIFDPELKIATIDHSMWFHHPVNLDDWLLYAMESPSASGGRGLVKGYIFNRQGKLLVTTMQEGVIRHRKKA